MYTAAQSRYVHLSDVDHVQLRRSMYLGMAKPVETKLRLAHLMETSAGNTGNDCQTGIEIFARKEEIAPAALQCIDEILQNALDEARTKSDVTLIEISYDKTLGSITVKNNGSGIPVEPFAGNPALGLTPTVVFSRLRTSDKYYREETQTEMAGGMNGLGAKLTNLSSQWFQVEVACAKTKRTFKQEWRNCMRDESAPVIKESKAQTFKGFVRVSFVLDWSSFEMSAPAVLYNWLACRAIDLAGIVPSSVRVQFYGKTLPVRGLDDLAKANLLGATTWSKQNRLLSASVDRGAEWTWLTEAWHTGTAPRSAEDDSFHMATIEHQVGTSSVRLAIGIKARPAEKGEVPDVIGFVNGLPCHEGTHANWAFLQLAHKIKIGDKTVHPATLRARRQVFFVIDLSIPNPDFSSYTKESLKTPSQKWPCLAGGWEWPDAVDKLIKRSKLVESLQRVAYAEAASEQLSQLYSKIDEQTSRGARRRVNVEGLADAAQAGTGNQECMLWITEGKSAMTHLMGGMSQAQRSVFGMMAIRGKILNALKHSDVKTMANTEIMGIIAAMGLSIKARDDVSKLRYPGGIVWATDQDGDGRHIAALGTVTLCTLFPVLRAIPGFFKFLNTPLLRCKGLGRDKSELEFDSSQDFIDWKRRYEAAEGCAVEDRFAIKYYKGLATLESADVRRVFQQLAARLVTLVLDEETHAIMLKYFDKDQEDARKDALCELANRLNRGETAPIIYAASQAVRFEAASQSVRFEAASHFVRFDTYMYWDVGAFFLSDVIRSVFMYVDGLKPSQRKYLYALLSKKVKHGRDYAMNGVRVAQMAAAVAESMHYHHGEVSMQETIVRMAQNIVGVNNVPYVEGLGGFGNRMDAPKETHGQPRYIFVKHGQLLERLFPRADMPVLPVLLEEGDEAEAVHLVPPVPLLLFNGGGGIGTGWSTNVLPRNPLHVCEATRAMVWAMRAKLPHLGYAGSREDLVTGSIRVEPVDWEAIVPASLGAFDAGEPGSEWERQADGLEPYFRGFQGHVERVGAKFVTWGRARAWQERNRVWIEIYELPIQVWVADVLKALDKLEPETDVGKKRKADKGAEGAKGAKGAYGAKGAEGAKAARASKGTSVAAGLVLDVQDLSSEHKICVRVQVAPTVMGRFVDMGTMSAAPQEIVNKELLTALGLHNTHSTSNMHGLVKPALTQARDEQVKTPRGPWTKELGGRDELLSLDVWPGEPWILKMQRLSTLFALQAKYRIATYLRRLAFEREVLRRRHLKKREIWRFLTLVHGKEIVLDECVYADVEASLRARGFATNADLSLAFAGDEGDKSEGDKIEGDKIEGDKSGADVERNPFSYLLDLPRSLSLSEKWRRLEKEVEELMGEYVCKLGRTVWDEWLDDLDALQSAIDAFLAAAQTDLYAQQAPQAPQAKGAQGAKKMGRARKE